MTQDLPHGFRERLEGLFSNLRQGTLHLRRLFVHKLVAKEIDVGKITARVSDIEIGDTIGVDHINEYTPGHGVDVDGAVLKDGGATLAGNLDVGGNSIVEVVLIETPLITPDSDAATDNIIIQSNEARSSFIFIKSWGDGTPAQLHNVLSAADGIPLFSARTGQSIIFGSPLAMGSNKVTGLTAGSASNEAVEYDQLHAQAHGPSDHTSFANWKLIYTDGSGDQQEIAVGADGTVLTGTSATGAPEFGAADDHAHVSQGSITTVGALDAGSITSNFGTIDTGASAITTTGALGAGETTLADGASLNLQEAITFTGAATENIIEIPDNLIDALSVNQGANTYLRFVTTDGFEAVAVLKTFAVLGNITVTGVVDGVDIAARDHAQAHAGDHVDGTDDIQNATDAQKGLATAAQITKLDAIAAGADVSPTPQLKAHLDDTDVHATTIKGFTVWEGDASVVFKYRMNSATAVGAEQTFKVYKDGAEEIVITIANGNVRSNLSGTGHTLTAAHRVTVLHTAGNDSGTRFELTGIRQ